MTRALPFTRGPRPPQASTLSLDAEIRFSAGVTRRRVAFNCPAMPCVLASIRGAPVRCGVTSDGRSGASDDAISREVARALIGGRLGAHEEHIAGILIGEILRRVLGSMGLVGHKR